MKKIKYFISYMNRISTWEPRTDLIESTENERLKKSLKKCKDKIKIIERELRECRERHTRPPAYNPEMTVVYARPFEEGASKKKKKSKKTKKRKKSKKSKKKKKK
tara:strand:+ start:155 stop:469 length:315 start_codon:yes stop_codon:yes gene_type:complete